METRAPMAQKGIRQHLNNVEWPISSWTQASKIRLCIPKNEELFSRRTKGCCRLEGKIGNGILDRQKGVKRARKQKLWSSLTMKV